MSLTPMYRFALSVGAIARVATPHARRSVVQRGVIGLLLLLWLVGSASAQTVYPEDGIWWNPDFPGRGYVLERQGDTMVFASYHFASDGTPEWLTLAGTYVPADVLADTIGTLSGDVSISTSGQCIGCAYVLPTVTTSTQSPATLTFSDNQHATLEWPGESIELSRYFFSFANSLEQLAGSWAVVTIPVGENPTVELVQITVIDGVASLTNAAGAVVGAIELADGDLTLSVSGLDADLPLLVPETNRFYAGSRSADLSVVIGLRTDDLPIVSSSTTTDGVDISKFLGGALAETVTTEECTLSGGAVTTCYRITVAGYPADRDTGPFCPSTITDGADAGGIWFDGNAVYDMDGSFIENLATIYSDSAWRMYDDQGNVMVTETAEEFEAAARPDVDPALQNHCVEGRLEWLENGEAITSTVLIPVTPVPAASSTSPRGNYGVSLDGVVIAASAPVDAILGAYTIAAFDDCGGHYNPFEGYHMHAATGCSEVGAATAGEPPIFGYALDGYALHSPFEAGQEPADLDECNGHVTVAAGYHYHANSAAKNQIVQCLKGQTVAVVGGGGPPPPPGG